MIVEGKTPVYETGDKVWLDASNIIYRKTDEEIRP